MLKRLRIKFIVLTMAMIIAILACVSVGICVFDRQQSISEVYRALDSSLAPAVDQQITNAAEDDETPNTDEDNTSQKDESSPQLEIGGSNNERKRMIPVAVYILGADGSLETVESRTTASIDETVLATAVERLEGKPDGHGELDDLGLLYAIRTAGDATLLAFADETSANSWQSLAAVIAAIDAGALVLFFVVAWFFSKWALRPVERSWTQQQQFVADASHELKTPIAVILTNLSILLRHPEDSIASQSRWIESTQTEAVHMQNLVTDMLELASLDERAKENRIDASEPERFDFSDLVETELLQFESISFESSIGLEGKIAPDVFVRGDKTKAGRIVSTLIDNAIKYSDEGGAVRVSLEVSGNDKIARLAVHNEGASIASEDLPHLFDRFYRADKARTRSVGGYGLGLAIARETARSFGGDIVVASSEDEGTTFTVTLPTA